MSDSSLTFTRLAAIMLRNVNGLLAYRNVTAQFHKASNKKKLKLSLLVSWVSFTSEGLEDLIIDFLLCVCAER